MYRVVGVFIGLLHGPMTDPDSNFMLSLLNILCAVSTICIKSTEIKTLCYSPFKWPPLMGYSMYNGYLPIQPSTYLQNKISKLLASLILTLNSENYYKTN